MRTFLLIEAVISIFLVIAIAVVTSNDFFSGLLFGIFWTLTHLTIIYLLKKDN